ncbi:NAD-dependent epimerase/dehydratase family protein [Microbacterium azadirachtae]|uniref:NAD-dependent epimerase/dehydratase family protein n=1 Tax=Microbacterium azadirachtae TaxID=582680 RepID=UPI0008884D06|nr:NAD-dependent epimerase/dehydratase family protein [Microbacterium azadirachtae]SDM20076.1 Nucleoside-diphosphate-sugar epimerase [Microbacterium azadirachtae]SEG42456.1 Nucleoside-diphosphate-sugar epimerase [Microbacterium azadirachtae]SEG45568.1 Nucleoside-diphosphate-sugar epimerase [Microbacterium azadirachtae]
MKVLLTGATGYIGSSVLSRLLSEGHEVTALVRDAAKARTVEEAGARGLVGDVTDAVLVAEAASVADGVIHTASTPEGDAAFIDAVLGAFGGSGKPFVHTGGIWSYGTSSDITEQSPLDRPALTAWRGAGEARVLGATGVRGTVVAPALVYGRAGGLIRLLTDETDGGVRLIGDGSQHWTTVDVDDLAALYVLALEKGRPGATYIGASGQNPTVRELGEAIAAGYDVAEGVRPESDDDTRARLGEAFADALLLDEQASGATARTELGWAPVARPLVEQLAAGEYLGESVAAH